MATLMMQHLQSATARKNMYLMECTTPLYQWAIKKFGSHRIVGSEYFGAQCQPGEIIKAWRYHPPFNYSQLRAAIRHQASLFYSMLRLEGVQHEDVTRLSFESDSLDLIISNDVFEHIPNPKTAFTECARVLRTGGVMLATLPFHVDVDSSITRASIADGELVNLLPLMYHGNPVSSGGSLVFTDFGWDVIEHLKQAGFSEVTIKCYSSAEFGHFGGVQIIFCLTK
jgi:SAM-dependent methyltransferase